MKFCNILIIKSVHIKKIIDVKDNITFSDKKFSMYNDSSDPWCVQIMLQGSEKKFYYAVAYKKEDGYQIILYINKKYETARNKLKDIFEQKGIDFYAGNEDWLQNRDGYSGRYCITLGIKCPPEIVAKILRMYMDYTKDDVIREINLIKK